RSSLGILRAGLGRLLGMGSGRERVLLPVAHGNGLPAFRDDAGEARHAENVECVAHFLHVHALHLGNSAYPQRNYQFCARLCSVANRRMVWVVFASCFCCLSVLLHQESRSSSQRTSSGIVTFPRIKLPFSESCAIGCLLCGALGNTLPTYL